MSLDLAAGLGDFELDADKISAALVNLLTNAIKFTPDRGDVALRARLDGPDIAEIQVEDHGVGIEPEAFRHLFEPFFTQLDPSCHSSGEFGFQKRGLGLGLSIARQFVEMHGGRVSAERLEAGGTRMTVRLPRREAEEPPPLAVPDGRVE